MPASPKKIEIEIDENFIQNLKRHQSPLTYSESSKKQP